MLADLIRKTVPIRYRQNLGLWTIRQACRTKLLMYPYFLTLYGSVPKGVETLKDGDCAITYQGSRILSPREGILAGLEVLQEEVYERFYRPKPGDCVLDIGAYVGMFTIKAAQQVGEEGLVVAVEPSKSNLEYLTKNVAGMPNVRVLRLAASHYSGCGRLTISNASPCHTLLPHPYEVVESVAVTTVDKIALGIGRPVDFIKVDAEGSEVQILKGASNTLKTCGLRLAIAAYHDLPTGEKELPIVRQMLGDAGFRVRTVKGYVYAAKLPRMGETPLREML